MDSADVERLHLMFDNGIGFSRGVRKIIRRFLNNVDQAVEKSSPLPKVTADDISRAANLIANVALDDDPEPGGKPEFTLD